MQLADFDSAAFLRDYWQKKPLLIRNPWKRWANPLDPDELAGLACEEGIEARMIKQAQKSWQAEHGPFAEERFARNEKQPWTLLVQAVDHHVPEVAALIAPFRFLPNWRIDDVMVSYASDGGGVGPHFDQYDVFLVQGLGRRRWQIGGPCDDDTPLLPSDDVRLLANFEPLEEWVLEPGDILYVPPRIAHNGVAVGDDCMTYSVGFRAPARSELLAHWCDEVLAGAAEEDRYSDPDLTMSANPGEIRPEAIDRLHALAVEGLLDRDAFARWFGGFTSTRKYPDTEWAPEEPIGPAHLAALIAAATPLIRNPASRFAFIEQPDNAVLLFVDGETFAANGEAAAFARNLCRADAMTLAPEAADGGVIDLLGQLFNQGSVAFDCED